MLLKCLTNSRLLGILGKALHGGASIQVSTIFTSAVIPESPALWPALLPTAALTLLPVPPPSQTYTHMLWMTTTPVHHGIFILNLTFLFLCLPCVTWDLSSSTRDWTHAPCSMLPAGVLTPGLPGKSLKSHILKESFLTHPRLTEVPLFDSITFIAHPDQAHYEYFLSVSPSIL